ncbi:hypothetical protein KFK09_026599 [Dendrobium nobile]|uniref:Uncharacterized protein n=1 Tax=Dendrobium nobile TaxID=94219 RepID=A0A8T3A873_DENNO|nr:hypothetical protein KFK09_026599 [Dendrobium nobile]
MWEMDLLGIILPSITTGKSSLTGRFFRQKLIIFRRFLNLPVEKIPPVKTA